MTFDPRQLRIGIGHDTHRLGPHGPLRIGGVDIDFDQHLIGHSDADVLLHAVTDAILGGAAMGDIGMLFPNDDQSNLNRDSAEMLKLVTVTVRNAGFDLINIDCIVFAEQPKLAPYREQIKLNIAACLNVSSDRIGVKSKTGEQVDAVGQRLAISAQCVALLWKRS